MAVERIAILGAGLMGRGIAHAAAVGGFETTLVDVAPAALEKALGHIGKDLDEGVVRGKLSDGAAAAARARLSSGTDLETAARAADFVVEAVPEDIGLKLATFARLDAVCRPEVVLATNTSALSVTEIASATQRPGRVLGMHFFNPVPKMKLVEIVRALDTSADAIATTEEVARRMGKETVLVRDSAGFITSRVNAMIGNEAFLMLEGGIASARDIDKALKLGLNHPMGPFELVDLVGLDTRLAVLEFLHKSLGERYRPAPLLVQHVKAGRLGRKVGRGVYDYEAADVSYAHLLLAVEGRARHPHREPTGEAQRPRRRDGRGVSSGPGRGARGPVHRSHRDRRGGQGLRGRGRHRGHPAAATRRCPRLHQLPAHDGGGGARGGGDRGGEWGRPGRGLRARTRLRPAHRRRACGLRPARAFPRGSSPVRAVPSGCHGWWGWAGPRRWSSRERAGARPKRSSTAS